MKIFSYTLCRQQCLWGRQQCFTGFPNSCTW